MTPRFTSFVILGAMRTGSNFLEASLSELAGVVTYGEVFNPAFIGRAGRSELLGIDLVAREANPQKLLERMRSGAGGLPGFRYFQDHDPRVFSAVMDDPACAKIILSRNPVDSFISLKIALKTDEWMITGEKRPTAAKVRFDLAEFEPFLEEQDAFYARVRHRLQVTGQTAFEVSYDEASDVEVLNGIAAWLGLDARLEKPSGRLRRQNPTALADKVVNPEDVARALAQLDLFRRDRPRSAEPERNAAIQSYVAAPRTPILFLPMPGGPVQQVKAWLAAVDGAKPPALRRGFRFRTLQEWREANPGYRSFTVLRHPVERAHAAFCTHLLMPGPECYGKIRNLLSKYHFFDFPDAEPGRDYTPERHRALFLQFLDFARRNLDDLTSIRVDAAWASQEAVLRGFAKRQIPDRLIREERLAEGVAEIAAEVGAVPPALPPAPPSGPVPLAAIYDAEIEAAARAVYGRDYAAFGFGDWRPPKLP